MPNIQKSSARTDQGYSNAERFRNALWSACQLTAFGMSPPFLRGYRRLILRAFGASIGEGSNVSARARIHSPWNLQVGRKSLVSWGCFVYCLERVQIGDLVTVSFGTTLCTGSHDFTSAGFNLLRKPIEIGSRVWIGCEAFIGPGVVIGDGAVIAARAVVTKDVPPATLWAGNPARCLREIQRPFQAQT